MFHEVSQRGFPLGGVGAFTTGRRNELPFLRRPFARHALKRFAELPQVMPAQLNWPGLDGFLAAALKT